jgi:hypothetical protein
MTVLNNIGSGFNRSTINSNFDIIEDELNNKVIKKVLAEGEDNTMQVDLDMNSNRMLNLPAPSGPNEPVRVQDLPNFIVEGNDLLLVTREEELVLTAGQTAVTLSTLTTTQTAFYISGLSVDQGRLVNNTDYTVTNTTQIVLAESYPTGTRLTAVQNEGVADLISDIQTFDNVASMQAASLGVGDTALCKRFYAGGELVEGLLFNIVAENTGTDNNGDFHDLVNGLQAKLVNKGFAHILNFGAASQPAVSTDAFVNALSSTRNVSFENTEEIIYDVNAPVMLRNMTNLKGSGQQSARIGDTLSYYSGVTKTNNSTVVITNPQRPTQTVDCLFYTNGLWEDGKFPQNFKLENMTLKSDSPSTSSVAVYQLQGSGMQMESVDILDFAYAFECYEFWSSTFKKVRTNGKMAFRRGTSVHLDQCSSGGSANSGTTTGGFVFDQFRYSTLTSCSSDGNLDTAYTFDNSYSIEMNGCACEFVDSPDDDTGTMINFMTGNQVNVNGFYGVNSAEATKANFSFGGANTVRFYGGKTGILAESTANVDVVVTGNSTYVEFHQFQFNNFSYNNPVIRFNVGVVDSFIIVHGKVANVPPKVYYTDGSGATLVRNGIIDTGSNANGTWIRFDDGTMECYHTLPKAGFLIGATASTTVQGIIWYRSNVVNWLYPIPFIASDNNVQITPRTGSVGARFASTRYSNTGETNAQTGQIQLVGVEDYIAAGVGYTNLTDVKIRAIGRWK